MPVSTKEDVEEAVKNARAAFPAWSDLSYDERATQLLSLADGIEANSQAFQDLLVKESGKPAQTAAIEVAMSVGHLREITKLRIPEEVIEDTDERSVVVRHIPLGVGCGIVPWNWPLLLGIGKVGSALLTGNTFIWKPSPFTPYSGLKLGELAARIFPPGVIQVLSGGDDLGPMLTEHPGIDKISFTGSTFTGKKVMESCSRTLKRVTLELGGNDPAIICDDVDLEKVVPKVRHTCPCSSFFTLITNLPEDRHLRLPQLRPDLHGYQAHLRPREDLRPIPHRARRVHQSRQDGPGL